MGNMVYFISGPKYSGKTTRMHELLKGIDGAAGFITEKIYSGNEVSGYDIRNLQSGELTALARRKESAVPEDWAEETFHGAFRFSLSALDTAKNIIERAIQAEAPAIFIDELGKLELNQQGHYRAIKDALNSRADVYITVRDINLESALKLFSIQDYTLIEVVHNR